MDIERIQSVSKPFVPSLVIKCIQMKLNANIYMFSFFKIRTKRTLKTLVLIGSLLLIATTSGDALRFSSAQEVAAPYSYDLITWHFENFLSKWTHRASRYLPWNYLSDAERQSLVAEYFEMTPRMQELKDIIRTVSSEAGNDSGPRLAGLESELDLVRARREHLQPDVVEVIESAISAVAVEQRLGALGEFVFPPVDIRLTEPPKVLITSPRDRIERTNDVLVDPHVQVEDREAMESRLLESDDLSALVIDIGGVATYPASLYSGGDIKGTLRTAAHEWLHHYLFFKPLGQNIYQSSEMQALNETLANIAGKEIGDIALRNFAPVAASINPSLPIGNFYEAQSAAIAKVDEFDFQHEMRKTRERVDELLDLGKIAAAESFMEEQRQVFVANGFNIRKLNQAYFAFNGTYADNAASSSPIADQLNRYRAAASNVGSFVKMIAGFSSYQKFMDELDELDK